MSSVHVGFSVNFSQETLHHYPHMTPGAELQLREQYMSALMGASRAAFLDRFSGEFAPLPRGSIDGHLGGHEAHRVACDAIAAYNALGTGITLSNPEEPPHCVRYEVREGEIVTIYNWGTEMLSCGASCPPPGGMFHVIVYCGA